MKLEKKVTKVETETIYKCDVCGEESYHHRGYGSWGIRECVTCGKDG